MYQTILFALCTLYTDSDSLRTETINGKVYVIHQVEQKETLYSLSRRYGSTVAGIIEQNPASDAGIEVGQILRIPYTAKVKAQTPVQTSQGLVHKVVAGETLYSIARDYSVTVGEIRSWNNLKENSSLAVGQEIVVKKKETVAEIKTPVTSGAKTHTVVAGETLYSIARQSGVTVQQLKDWNALTGDEVKLGQVLTVASLVPVITTTTPVTTTTTTTTTTPVVKTGTPTENVVRISESVAGSDEIRESGLAELIEGTEGNRKYLAQHRTIKPGTILKIRNLNTNQEVFVRVTGPIPNPKDLTVICVSKSAWDRLGASESTFRAEITYYK